MVTVGRGVCGVHRREGEGCTRQIFAGERSNAYTGMQCGGDAQGKHYKDMPIERLPQGMNGAGLQRHEAARQEHR
jgi:hypothetical protein